MNCSVLINSQNYFLPYLTWLLNNRKNLGFSIVGLLAKDPNKIKSNIPAAKSINFFSSADEAISASDLTVSLGYWKVLSQKQISNSPVGILNFHHSYKLKYKGRHCATWAIRNNETVHGSTMHFIDEKLDSGHIVDTDFFKIKKFDTAQTVFEKANEVGLKLLTKNFKKIINKESIKYKKHSEKCFSYKHSDLNHEISCRLLYDEDRLLTEIRALTFKGAPSPFIKINGRKIFLKMEGYDSGILTNDQQ